MLGCKYASCFFLALAACFGITGAADVTSGYQALSRKAVQFCTRDIYPSDYPDADVIVLLFFYGFRIGEIGVRMYASPHKRGMHAGFASLFYVFKMFLSMFLMLIRKRT